MADPEADFAQLIEVLRQAQHAAHRELELRHKQDFNREALLRLLAAVRSFADQAQALFILMANSDPEDVSMVEVAKAHGLATSFSETEERIEAIIELGRW